MPNQHIENRLNGLLENLSISSTSIRSSSSATKGAARAFFIKDILEKIMPTGLRISKGGEVTDLNGSISGELDIIIENGHFPSISINDEDSRLFFAESVGAVIEIKSDIKNDWSNVLRTGNRLYKIERKITSGLKMNKSNTTIFKLPFAITDDTLPIFKDSFMDNVEGKVPYFVVGYKGWADFKTIKQKLVESDGVVSGILQLDKQYFCSNSNFNNLDISGALSLLGFINSISEASSYLQTAVMDFMEYGK